MERERVGAAIRAIVSAIVEPASDAVIVIDPEGRPVATSSAHEAVVDLASRLAAGSEDLEHFRARLRETGRARTELLVGRAPRRPRRLELEGTAIEGFWVVLVRGALADGHDEARRRRRRLESTGLLTLTIAHDMNNLLTPILFLSRRIADGRTIGPAEVQAAASDIHDAAEGAASLNRQLLAFGRGRAARPARVNVGEMVVAMRSFLDSMLGRGVELALSLDDPDAQVLVDRERFEHVLLNLAANARDAMPAGGRAAIRTAVAGGYVVLTVADTGAGIAPDLRERIFDEFFTTKEPGRGTGLGLASVQRFVVESGGFVTVESELGKGAAIAVHLPIAGDGERTT